VFITYVIVTVFAAATNIFSATLDFIHYKQILINMARVGVSESWLTTLGILKAAGALGLLIGIRVPLIGIAAAIGLVLFFVAAIITHLRGRDYSFGLASGFVMNFTALPVAKQQRAFRHRRQRSIPGPQG